MTTTLGHLKVLDLTRILAGPWATQNLADMGAEVIKVERPVAGDDTRAWGPPFLKDPEGRETQDSSYFLSANRGKKSITVDLAHPDGQALIRELAAQADVLVENYKVGTLARYGLDYDSLRALNPRLVYCSVTGFGQDGPYAALPGYDFVFQGMGGLMSITGQAEGAPGDEPMKVGIAISDLLCGMYATTAILAALEHRHVSGKGQHIDMSLLDCVVTVSSYQAINYFLSDQVPRRMGNAHSNMVPYLSRALTAYRGLGALPPSEAIYPSGLSDSDGKPLDGKNKYLLRFAGDALPPAGAFWSVTMYGDDHFLVANPIDRFAIGNRDALQFGKDGSLEIYVQHESPGAAHESNWLPAPAAPFSLQLRLYAPAPQALDGRWSAPAVRRVS